MEWFLLTTLILAMVLAAIGALGLLIWVVDHDFEPAVKVEGIGVSVKDGFVTSKGSVEQMLQATSRRKGSGKPRKFPKWPS